MMKRYRYNQGTTLWYDDGNDIVNQAPNNSGVSICVDELGPQLYDTGILDADGNPITFYEVKRPIGFYRIGED